MIKRIIGYIKSYWRLKRLYLTNDWETFLKKVKARNKTQLVKIPKRQLCENKGCKNLAIQKHHPDYDEPTKLVFLCRNCHTKITYGGNSCGSK